MNNKNSNNKPKNKKDKKTTPKANKNPSKSSPIVKKSFPLPPQPDNYKQINELYDIGKLELVDYKGNITECDIYGKPKKKFLTNITGITSFRDRICKGLINECKLKNKSLYIPKANNFEGSSMFPRPISLPFVSLLENPKKLVKEAKKEGRAMTKKNKNVFSLRKPLKDNNTIPSFICQKIGQNSSNERNYLIKLIDKYILEKKKEHKFEVDYTEKSSSIKALKNYKKKLNENMSNELYNGKIILPPKQKDLMLKYDSIRKAIYNTGLKNNSSKSNMNRIINFEAYKKLYKIKGVGNNDNIFKNPDMIKTFSLENPKNNIEKRNMSYSIEKNKYQIIFSKKNEINPMLKTFSSLNTVKKFDKFKENNKEKNISKNDLMPSNDKFIKTLTTEFEKNSESLTNTCNDFFYHKNNMNLYMPNTYNFNNNLNKNNFNKTSNTFYRNKKNICIRNRNIDNLSNNEKDSYSYISEEKKNDKFDEKFKTGFNFLSIKDINKKALKENNLLKGFITPEIRNNLKELKVFKNKKKDSTLKHYIDEMELIQKVNKIAVEKEKRINIFRDNLLKKKLEGKKIFEQNYKK